MKWEACHCLLFPAYIPGSLNEHLRFTFAFAFTFLGLLGDRSDQIRSMKDQ